jgi:stage V sporulation protein R
MIQVLDMANKRFEEFEKAYGMDELEQIIDAAHALQFHSSPFDIETEDIKKKRVFEMLKKQKHKVSKAEYRDLFDQTVDEVGIDIKLFNQKLYRRIRNRTPVEPAGDLLRYIADYSTKLEEWQKDICEILRLEGQYFWPQIKTKYMNEAFATFWHQRMMKRLFDDGILTMTEHAEYNYSNSLVKAKHPMAMNPYLIGSAMWEDIVTRWDKGRHGREYDDCEDRVAKEKWDKKDGKGLQKMFQVLSSYTDWMFVQDFLTPQLVDDLDLYVFVVKDNPTTIDVIRTQHDAKEVRDLIVASFSHSHIPKVEIININYQDAGKLYLKHQHAGADLQFKYATETMKHIHRLWGRDCILETYINKKPILIIAHIIAHNGEVGHEEDKERPEQADDGCDGCQTGG